jgi:hypothetical protein
MEKAGRRQPIGKRKLATARALTAALALAALSGAAGTAAGAAVGTAAGTARGTASGHTLKVTDAAHLTLTRADGNTLYERGRATGTLAGTVEVSMTLRGHAATSTFTIRTSAGTIGGRGSGTLKTGKGGYDSFGGSVTVTRATGRFHGATGTGGLYGSIYRVTDAMSVQVTGTLRY